MMKIEVKEQVRANGDRDFAADQRVVYVDGVLQGQRTSPVILEMTQHIGGEPMVRLHGEIVDDLELYYGDDLAVRIPLYPTFVVEGTLIVRDRGPMITRGKEPAGHDYDNDRLFAAGDELYCVGRPDLAATVAGIELWRGGSHRTRSMQQALLLSGILFEDLAIGQVWKVARSNLLTLLPDQATERPNIP